jgi:hypothetical protein
MTIVRRALLLTIVAVSGIALIAPLAARSAALTVETPRDALLADRAAARIDVPRGGVLSARSLEAASTVPAGAEAVEPRAADSPVTVPMEATLYAVPTAPVASASRPVPAFVGGGVWDALAQCESGGNWAINTGNGYFGGLQFSLGTWNQYGGAEYAAYPHQATRAEQIAVAERLRAARGYQPWPSCRAKLGLP